MDTTNDYGQKTITGIVTLAQTTEMLNVKNDGLEPSDRRWQLPSRIVVPAGAEVEFRSVETRTGKYETLTYRDGNKTFSLTKKVDNISYGN